MKSFKLASTAIEGRFKHSKLEITNKFYDSGVCAVVVTSLIKNSY